MRKSKKYMTLQDSCINELIDELEEFSRTFLPIKEEHREAFKDSLLIKKLGEIRVGQSEYRKALKELV